MGPARDRDVQGDRTRDDYVLALLTEGEPSDSFPSQLLERERKVAGDDGSITVVKEDTEPLAADVRASRHESMARLKRFALLRLVACILGVKFDDLRQREHERQRRHWVLGAAAAVAACPLLRRAAASGTAI